MAAPCGLLGRAEQPLPPGRDDTSWRSAADEVADLGIDLIAPTLAVEDAVVADLGLHVVRLLASGKADAEVERGCCLADGADVVLLALDADQLCPRDGARLDQAAATLEEAQGERVLLEHPRHRLQKEVGGEVHHRHVLVVEFARALRALAVAAHEMLEEIHMRRDMAVEVHRHEAAELQEARIDAAEGAL